MTVFSPQFHLKFNQVTFALLNHPSKNTIIHRQQPGSWMFLLFEPVPRLYPPIITIMAPGVSVSFHFPPHHCVTSCLMRPKKKKDSICLFVSPAMFLSSVDSNSDWSCMDDSCGEISVWRCHNTKAGGAPFSHKAVSRVYYFFKSKLFRLCLFLFDFLV